MCAMFLFDMYTSCDYLKIHTCQYKICLHSKIVFVAMQLHALAVIGIYP